MTARSDRRIRSSKRHGLSLMEVVLALAILGISLAMIGELIRLGSRAGEAARDDLESQLICESLINEVAASTQVPEPVIDQPVDELGEWLYSVETQPVDEGGLLAVRVSVRRADKQESTSARIVPPYSLTRWIVDPEVEMAAREAEAVMKEQLKLRAATQASGTQTGSATIESAPPAGGNNTPPANQTPATPPEGLPPGFDPSKLPPGFDPKNIDPSKLPPGLDLKNFDPSKLPPGLLPGGGRGQRGGGRGSRGGGS